MNPLLLEIGEVVMETEAERVRVEGAAPAVVEAFRLLANRLKRMPLAEFGEQRQGAIELLTTTVLQLDELLSPRGAARLADDLYRQLVRRGS